jgi:hypothetical protein
MARGTCWVGYEQKGMKMKKGKRVPNCVKKASKGEYMDESKAHESKESRAEEARETRLEKKGYVETKSGKMKKVQKAYTGRAVRQPTETDTEFEIRHEYHTPFKGPQKAKDGVMIKNKSKKISTESMEDDEYYPTGAGKEYPGGFMPEIRGTLPPGFQEPQEIKNGGLIKGKPKIALRGWK